MQAWIPNIAMAIQAYAAHQAGSKLELFEYEVGSLKPDEVEIDVEYCGICRSDLSMLKFQYQNLLVGKGIIGLESANSVTMNENMLEVTVRVKMKMS